MDVATKPEGGPTVMIQKEEYSIVECPPENSSLVLKMKEDLYDNLNLNTFVEQLTSVARFIRVTYYATGAAPPVEKVQELRIDIYHLGLNISKLCDESFITVSSFKSTSETIMEELQASYEYLLDGFETMAMDSLSTLSEHAEKMAQAAEKMKQKFEQQAKEVNEIALKTMKTSNKHDVLAKKLKEKQVKLENDKEYQEKMKAIYLKEEERAREERKAYQAKEDAEIEALDTGFWPTLGRMLLGKSGKEKAERYREEKIQFLQEEVENRKQRQKAMAEQARVLKDMAECNFDEIEFTKVVHFLEYAVTALKGLAAVMEKAVLFWRQLQEHCKNMASKGIKNKIEQGMKLDSEERRLEFWTSRAFKVSAVKYFARWVALYSMCGEHMGVIRGTQKELYHYITENPNREQCRETLPKLCMDFSSYESSSQENTDQQNSRDQKAIEDLQKGDDNMDYYVIVVEKEE